jgi:UDP-N-acetylmuramoyl-L-alanyl-D-glutamate--2,6-diaminopimelate ligase
MYLQHLLDSLARFSSMQVAGSRTREITSLVYDSRRVVPGSIFVAIKGYHTDGHSYIPQARERGAAAIVVEGWNARHLARWQAEHGGSPLSSPEQAPPTLISVPNSRAVLAPLAAAFYDYPAQRLGVVGVTGTKGKSTTTELVSRALEGGGFATGFISTVDFKLGSRQWPNTTRQSTPEAPEVQALLHEMAAAGCDYAVLEASSHGLSEQWNRLGNCMVDVALFLNLSHEHLDYHGSFEQYRHDKCRLFAMLGEHTPTHAPRCKQQKHAIVNADDPNAPAFFAAAPATAHRLTYGIYGSSIAPDIRAYDITTSPGGSQMRIATPWGECGLHLHLPGAFNIYNALAALSVALSQGVSLEQAAAALEAARSIRGRMQRIIQGQPFTVIVDYAHNPDSFAQVLGMLRPVVRKRIIALFGSAGERDRAKRPQQGAIAAQYCDVLFLTDEDPRGEQREAILEEIAAGARNETNRYSNRTPPVHLIPDRAAAIRAAFAEAQSGDLVLLLGKGHEGSIEYADGKHPWDEAAEARVALREMGFGNTP